MTAAAAPPVETGTRRPDAPPRRVARHLQALRRDPGPRPTCRWTSCPARSTPWSARTGPARARWSRSSPASTSPDSGTIRLDGETTQIHGPAHSRALGIAVVHQEPRLFPDLTVAENVFIGHAPSGRLGLHRLGRDAPRAQALFAELDVQFDVGAPVRGLSMADQQLIEIAKALSWTPAS